MRRRMIRLTLAVGAGVGLIAALTVPASALGDPGGGGSSSAPAAVEPVAKEHLAGHVEQRAQIELDESFGGAWLDGDELVVATTDPNEIDRIAELGATPKVVEHSEAELTELKERLDANSEDVPASVHAWSADVTGNDIVVEVGTGDLADAKEFVAASGIDESLVRYEQFDEAPQPLDHVQGGDAYYFGAGRCSIGFSIEGGFVTAGHCGGQGTAVQDHSQQAMGTVAGSIFPGADMAYVNVTGGQAILPQVNSYPGEWPVNGSDEAPIGAEVCRSGSTNGVTCGTIIDKNRSVQYAEGVVTGMTLSDACAGPGDSGGSWITPGSYQAQGVTSGGRGFCGSGQPAEIYFYPISPILSQWSLTLLTADGGSEPEPPDGTWEAGVSYAVGDRVEFGGVEYECVIAHLSMDGWDPVSAPALWYQV